MRCNKRHIFRIQHTKLNEKVGCRPSKSAKQRFKEKLRKLTSRKIADTFEEIVKRINQTTVGWINYYGIANMKAFIKEIQGWLNHRLRQLILKRWKKPRTRYMKLRQYGIDHEDAMKIANSRKGYWRLSRNEIIHRAITNEKLTKWGLKDLTQLYELRYLRD